MSEEEEQFCFKILFHGTNNRSYILGAESQECMEQWMKALACSSYDYMKLMVAELQRQLDDIEGNKILCDIYIFASECQFENTLLFNLDKILIILNLR